MKPQIFLGPILICICCKEPFELTALETRFYRARDATVPKLCRRCKREGEKAQEIGWSEESLKQVNRRY